MATLKKTKNGFQDRLSFNAGQKYCRCNCYNFDLPQSNHPLSFSILENILAYMIQLTFSRLKLIIVVLVCVCVCVRACVRACVFRRKQYVFWSLVFPIANIYIFFLSLYTHEGTSKYYQIYAYINFLVETV